MAIVETELVTLNGSAIAFGGRIYNASYSIGFNQSPSSVRLSIINESGEYNINENDLTVLGSPDDISFGGRNLKMYPFKFSKENSDGGKILTVEYRDASIIFLDKKFVVLNKTHVSSKLNSPDEALIIVGEKYYTETVDGPNGTTLQNLTTEAPNDLDLGQSLYYVSELYDVMVEHGIPMHSSVKNILLNKDGASDYLNNIVGNLRNVLLAWGNIMAFSFYWGEDNKLHFIDLESSINVNLEKLNGIIPFSDEETYSLENTVDRGYSLYYGRAGKAEQNNQNGVSKTSFYFRRGIEDLDDQSKTGIDLESELVQNCVRAAVLGESFFMAYILYLALPAGGNNSKVKTGFGLTSFESYSSNIERTLFEYVDDDGILRQTFNLVSFAQKDPIYSYGAFRDVIDKFITYERPMKESDRESFSGWTRQIEYDDEDKTDYINDQTENGGTDSDPEHRAYFTASISEIFDITPDTGGEPSDYVRPIDFLNKAEARLKGIDVDERTYLWVKKDIDFESILAGIDWYDYNSVTKVVKGFNPRTLLFSSITPKEEQIYIKKPSFNSNTVVTDMQIDSTDDNEVIIAGQSFETIADILNESYLRDTKSFTKTFSISGIETPQKISAEDGLQSINISNTNQRGTTSTYTVGNTFFKIPSKDIILQKLEREKFVELRNTDNFTFIFNAGGFNT
jgi:hypothetical protein